MKALQFTNTTKTSTYKKFPTNALRDLGQKFLAYKYKKDKPRCLGNPLSCSSIYKTRILENIYSKT